MVSSVMNHTEQQDKMKLEDPNAESRKKDHIELAFKSRVTGNDLDPRFYYEPLLSGHPGKETLQSFTFLGKTLNVPIWVSSMTGGTQKARIINHNLARACRDFGMGMGLGSCRQLLYDDTFLPDFDVRVLIGNQVPLYANLGIAQIEHLLTTDQTNHVIKLVDKLRADGLIIHVNPLQEALQPEGDTIIQSPILIIESFLEKTKLPLIVKEVGQGMGKESLKALLQLPLKAVEFAAAGGTNFSKLELLRASEEAATNYHPFAGIGHTAEEMVVFTNEIVEELGEDIKCQQVIVSGGVRDYLDGYYLINKLKLPAVYGQASGFLKFAQGSYDDLYKHIHNQIEGYKLAKAFLRVK